MSSAIDPKLMAAVAVSLIVGMVNRTCWVVHTAMSDLNDTYATGFAMVRYFGCSLAVSSDSGRVNLVRCMVNLVSLD